MQPNPCQIPELNISCFGCCGRDLKAKQEIENYIDLNNEDYHQCFSAGVFLAQEFKNRHSKDLLRDSGICYNVVWSNKPRNFCPLHPKATEKMQQKGIKVQGKPDLRDGHCNPGYKCDTLKAFENWTIKQKKAYINFIRKKLDNNELDWYSYSIKTDNNELLEEFRNI